MELCSQPTASLVGAACELAGNECWNCAWDKQWVKRGEDLGNLLGKQLGESYRFSADEPGIWSGETDGKWRSGVSLPDSLAGVKIRILNFIPLKIFET